MKHLLISLTALSLLISLAACGSGASTPEAQDQLTSSATSSAFPAESGGT